MTKAYNETKTMCPVKWFLQTLLVFQLFHFSASIDTITSDHSIKDGEVIVSSGKVFVLGFFSPANSIKRYIGVWYYQDPNQVIVWVANRDNPLNDKSGFLSINSHGNLVLFQGNKTVPVWSTNISEASTSNTIAQLLDTGNLVLVELTTNKLLWQGFDYPTNTLLPSMKLGLDRRTGLDRFLTSWKSPDDPGTGNYSYRIDPRGFPQLSLYQGPVKLWRTGSWTGKRWTGIPEMTSQHSIHNFSFVNNEDEVSFSAAVNDPSILSRVIVNETGLIERFISNNQDHRWTGYRSAPKEQCDYYGHCGENSNCNIDLGFECTCLPGFEPKNQQTWYLRDASYGCIRKQGMSMCQRGEGFVRVRGVKTPDTSVTEVDMSLSLKACEDKCLKNCSCLAYTSAYAEIEGGIGCLTYHGGLIDTKTLANVGQDLYVRVNATELALYAKNGSLGKKGIAVIAAVSSMAILLMLALIWFFKRKRAGRERIKNFFFHFTTSPTYLEHSFVRHEQIGSTGNPVLPLFDLNTIAVATNNFSYDHKLGEGGFGSVYKGLLPNGKEIAVKRLSKSSGQGIEEFKNEISLIAKLQHRNLVRILGCCIEAGEKMLFYEYLSNKSLDSFIFNETKRSSLDWRKRFEIICGIARGILYLHQDSRLRIIHRDLKASNILLDDAMNPKISDFGMARIFGENQIEANTKRVVGTYGYMSPEYAMHGLFSIKSDVYSFGILLLEIITGINNSIFHLADAAPSNLAGHVWDLWREGKSTDIVDKQLGESEPYPEHEVLRCIQIGLLCVQEQAKDRPTMSGIVSMLGNDNALASPARPAFIEKITSDADSKHIE